MSASLVLRPISELLAERFVVPSYQRGYRWTERQVTELLEDIYEFQRTRNERPKEAFYCLQPVVVRQRPDGAWELIDGQQRLTTILLILRVLDDFLRILRKSRFSLTYDTRPGSEGFLNDPTFDRHLDNIDFKHLYHAFETIKTWFSLKDGALGLEFLNCLLAAEDRNVKVIWYQLPDGENAIRVFVRLNVGKIPLTNSELIRALFLRDRNFVGPAAIPSRLQIAHEWGGIEKRLQEDAFWYFIHDGPATYPARIEYLFAIKVLELGLEVPPHDSYGTFLAYQRYFNEGGSVEECWREIRQLALKLDEWADDRVLYHLVGYRIATASAPSTDVVVELLAKRRVLSRSGFERFLKGLIFDDLVDEDLNSLDPSQVAEAVRERIEELSYLGRDRATIRAALLLFNVASLLRNSGSNLRFPFDLYKKDSWDIEHIRSVKSDMPARPEHKKAWLRQVVDYWKAQSATGPEERDSLHARAIEMLGQEPIVHDDFKNLYESILEYFRENDSSVTDHSMANLTLLDVTTNRSYKNAVFPVKRSRVLALDKAGTFVPLCTTNVFLKYYSSEIDQMMFWGQHDGERYRSAMIEMLVHFFCGGPQ